MPTSHTLSQGTTLKSNTYRIQRLLGTGGFGAVYLAEDLGKRTLCAIKESFDTSPGAQAQFAIEATILMMLQHPTLTLVTDHFIEPSGQQYLVMEYVEGQDLGDLLSQRGPLPERSVLGWMDQVLDAVAYLHAYKPRSVIHRDIKPDNIRLLPDGKRVKLVDFGIAKIGGAADKTRSVSRAVTRGFSPPEQYGSGTDTYSDVYALGATLYNLLTNTVPPVSIDRAHAGAQLIPPRQLNPQISPQVEQVILTAMEIDPGLRFPDAGEMRRALLGQRPAFVTVNCPNCGHPVRASARFCDKCGHPTAPVPPFPFKQAGFQARDLAELVRACDTYWQEALGYFRSGQIDAWLEKLGAQGRQLAAQGKALRAKHSDPSAALEEFLEAVSPSRTLPILTVTPTSLDFGALRLGDSKTLSLTIANSGRGYLHGSLQPSVGWITVHPAAFGCLAGAPQQVNLEMKTAGLSGTELGVDYTGAVTVLSSRGQQTVRVQVKVVDEPVAHLEPAQLDLGQVAWGSKSRGRVVVSNQGGGTLHGRLVSSEPWLLVDQQAQTIALGKGQSLPVAVTVDAAQFARRGQHSGRLQVQTHGRGNPVCTVTVAVDVPYLLDAQQPASAVSSLDDLIVFCDGNWERGLHYLGTGRIEAFLRFIGEEDLADLAAEARQQPDPSAGLERLLRAAGARRPEKWRSNAGDVLGQLGYGALPRLFGRPPVVSLFIQNDSRRGYLHGYVESLVPWLTVPQPRFGCRPGQVAEVQLHADHKARKGGRLLSLGQELFEIVME